jgi:multicomponent Na+:H+ antiporter subunit G
MIGEAAMLLGAALTLLAAVGVVRFPDALTRMHALTKASTVGFGLVAIGAAFELPTANDVTSALLAFVLQLLMLPVAATLIANSTYWSKRIPTELSADDELGASDATAGPSTSESEPAPTD